MQEKHLLLLRHGQAGQGARDMERPLTARGRADVQKVACWLQQEGLRPDRVIASAAQRTRETARLCCDTLAVAAEHICYEPSLYHADVYGWIGELTALPADVGTVLLVGHNPTLSWLASQLGGGALMLSTANLVHLTACDHVWGETMQMQQLIRPKDLG